MNDSASRLPMVVIANRASGTHGGPNGRTRIEAALRGAHLDARVSIVDGESLRDVAGQALRDGARTVVAAGGDGTLNAVASVLAGSTAVFGVLPLGTLNHFARDLGIPAALDEAAAVLAGGTTQRIDAGEVNGRLFLNNASLGLYPEIVRLRERERARLGIGKLPALAMATVRALRRHHALDVRVDADGEQLSVRTPFAFVGNNAYELEGFAAGARASLREGVLSLYTARDEGRLGLLRLMLRALTGHLHEAAAFTSLAATRLVIHTQRRHVAVAIDGEVEHFTPPLQYRSRPGALHVLVPAARFGGD